LAGLAMLALAAGLLAISGRDLVSGFAAVFLAIIGASAVVPGAVLIASRLAAPPLRRAFGILGAMAARGLAAHLSRTGVALAALVVAVATTVGVAVMVASFRVTLTDWLLLTLQSDAYVIPADAHNRGQPSAIDPDTLARLRAVDGTAYVSTYRRVEIPGTARTADAVPEPAALDALETPESVQTIALGIDPRAFRIFRLRAGGARDAVYDALHAAEADTIMVSEPFAYRHAIGLDDRVLLRTDAGPRAFRVVGVYVDFGSDRGAVTLARATYDRHWNDPAIHSLGFFADDGVDRDAWIEDLRAAANTGRQAIDVRANRELRRYSLEIFDRTFAITGVLRLLAVGIAFVGVLSALLALQLERDRELAVLRANGMTPAQVWGLVTVQTGLMGLVAGLIAMPVGAMMAALLVQVINRRAFGWTLTLDLDPALLLQAPALAVIAALLAGLLPAHRMAQASPARALRGLDG
ncbi:MAG: ABC transporter permease, partial [Acidobacteriota bacterium]